MKSLRKGYMKEKRLGSAALVDKLKDLSHVTNIITLDFKDLFNNIADLHSTINSLFIEYLSSLNLPDNIDIDYFITLSNFLLYHNFQNNAIFKQVIGILQGISSSSMISDLYLYFYERKFINNNILFFRHIDNIIILFLNDNKSISLPINYPSNLELSTTYLNNCSINFLDVNITISHNNTLTLNIYDKRNDFSFDVINFTNFNSCLHISVYRNILLNHCLRIKRIYVPPII